MNIVKRSILSITRNKTKSFLLISVSLMLGTFITTSFYVFQTTKLIEQTVKSQLSPIITINSIGKGLNDYKFTGDAYIENYSNEDREEFYNILVSYASDKRVKIGESYFSFYRKSFQTNYTFENYNDFTWNLIGVNNCADMINREIQDTEELVGRYFSDDELEDGKNVIIIFQDPRNILSPIVNIGDIIPYTFTHEKEIFTIDFEVIGIYNMIKHTQVIGSITEEYVDPIMSTYHNTNLPICNEAYIPYNTLRNIGEKLQEIEINRQKKASINSTWYSQNDLIGQIKYTSSIFKLKNVDDLESFMNDLNESLNNIPDISIESSMDSYLDVKNAVENLSVLAWIVIIVSILSSLLILSLIIYVYVKNRKNEVGLYLALGDRKRNIFGQLVLEISLICLLGFGLSFVSGEALGEMVTAHLIKNEQTFEEYNDEVMNEIQSGETFNQYVSIVAIMELLVIVIASYYPMNKIMKSNPKDCMMQG